VWLEARMVSERLFGPARGPDAFPIPKNLPPALAAQGTQILDACAHPPPSDVTLPAARIATRVLPYLSPAEGRDVLAALHDLPCLASLSGTQAQWRALLQAIALHDAPAFGDVADAMLANGEGTTVVKTRYLLAMAMLGRIRAGNLARAQELWTRFSPRVLAGESPGLVLELLQAHAFRAADRQ
jgi:hypothetical protein